jgi:hypothetical protein
LRCYTGTDAPAMSSARAVAPGRRQIAGKHANRAELVERRAGRIVHSENGLRQRPGHPSAIPVENPLRTRNRSRGQSRRFGVFRLPVRRTLSTIIALPGTPSRRRFSQGRPLYEVRTTSSSDPTYPACRRRVKGGRENAPWILSRLLLDHAAGKASPGVAGRISLVVVRHGVNHQRSPAGIEKRVRPSSQSHVGIHHSGLGSSSIPAQTRSVSSAAASVVPEPRNGS